MSSVIFSGPTGTQSITGLSEEHLRILRGAKSLQLIWIDRNWSRLVISVDGADKEATGPGCVAAEVVWLCRTSKGFSFRCREGSKSLPAIVHSMMDELARGPAPPTEDVIFQASD